MNEQICPKCKEAMTENELQEARDEGARTHGELVHPGCYWEALGEEIEAHPIHKPGLRT